jgi:hypothetical protein
MQQPPYQQPPQEYQQPPPGYGPQGQQGWAQPRQPLGPWVKRSRIAAGLLVGGAVLAIIATILPWGEVGFTFGTVSESETFNGFEGADGWLAIGTAVLVLVMGGLSFMATPPRRLIIPVAVISGLLLGFIGFANMSEPEGELGSISDFGGDFSPGIGLFVMVLAGLLVLAGAGLMIASQSAAPKTPVSSTWQAGQYGQQAPYQPPPQAPPPQYQQPGYPQPAPGPEQLGPNQPPGEGQAPYGQPPPGGQPPPS